MMMTSELIEALRSRRSKFALDKMSEWLAAKGYRASPLFLRKMIDGHGWERFWNKVDKSRSGGCWIAKPGKARAAYEYLYGEINDHAKLVLRKCSTKRCCSPEHIYLGYACDLSGLYKSERTRATPNRSFIQDSDHEEIRLRLERGETVRSLAKLYRASHSTICAIKNGPKKRVERTVPRPSISQAEAFKLRSEARERAKRERARLEARAEREREREAKKARWRLISDLYAEGLREERLRAAVAEQGFKTSSREKIFSPEA